MMFMYGSSTSTPRISERRTYRRNLLTAAEGEREAVYGSFRRFGRGQEENKEVVFWPTEARLLVGRELHEVRTGAGRSAVVINETQMRAGTASVIRLARVRGCGGGGEQDGGREAGKAAADTTCFTFDANSLKERENTGRYLLTVG